MLRLTKIDKWEAAGASLLMPGVGQLLAGSWTFVPWLAGAALIVALAAWLPASAILGGTLLVLGLASAEHARRLVESKQPVSWRPTPGTTATIRSVPANGRQVEVGIELRSPLSAGELWERVRQLETFLTIDPLHAKVTLMRSAPAAGIDLVLEHHIFGLRFNRFGRLLYWRPGQGFAFSDLSGRRPDRGFPHVFFMAIEPAQDGTGSRLLITCRGKWTSRIVSPRIATFWLRLVASEHARLLQQAM